MSQIHYQTPTLEASTSVGGQKFWYCTVVREGDSVSLYTYSWITKQDGTASTVKVSEPMEVVGKNLRRNNATSALEQGQLEAQSRMRKKLDEGYLDPNGNVALEWKPPILPMLAHSFNDRIHTVDWSSGPISQPKLDGQRTLYSKGLYWSRLGKKMDPVITAHLKPPEVPGAILDGELLINGQFQDTMKAIKKYRPGMTEMLHYHLYDAYFPDEPHLTFAERYTRLNDAFDTQQGLVRQCQLVPNTSVSSEDALLIEHSRNLTQGFEGTMLRNWNAPYQVGSRTIYLLKVKDFQDDEFTVVGYSDGRGRDSGAIVFSCTTPAGKTFEVRPSWSLEARREAYAAGQSYLGQKLTVRYFELSQDGIPRFPVGVGFGLDR